MKDGAATSNFEIHRNYLESTQVDWMDFRCRTSCHSQDIASSLLDRYWQDQSIAFPVQAQAEARGKNVPASGLRVLAE